MDFSIYSELQTWPSKTQQQVYAEAFEQCVNADRLGYSTYSIIEHFFFPKFGASPNPFAFFAKASERTRNIKFRTLVHVLPYHNPAVLASQIAQFDMLVEGRYEFGFGRGHGWIPLKGGVPVEELRDRYKESLKIVIDALDKERFSYDGKYYKIKDFPHRAAADARPQIPHLPWWHERLDLRTCGRARLCRCGATAIAI